MDDVQVKCRRMWANMKNRVKNDPDYRHVEIKMSRNEFLSWAEPRVQNFLFLNPTATPSVDRMDSDGHYEILNIRIIDLDENRRGSRFISNFLKLYKLPNEDERIQALAQNIVATCRNAGIDKKNLVSFLRDAV